MTKTNAMRFGEYIAKNNDHFDMWCREHSYADTNMYGFFQLRIHCARQAIAEYRKEFGFTYTEYRNWNRDYGWMYGTMNPTVRI